MGTEGLEGERALLWTKISPEALPGLPPLYERDSQKNFKDLLFLTETRWSLTSARAKKKKPHLGRYGARQAFLQEHHHKRKTWTWAMNAFFPIPYPHNQVSLKNGFVKL